MAVLTDRLMGVSEFMAGLGGVLNKAAMLRPDTPAHGL